MCHGNKLWRATISSPEFARWLRHVSPCPAERATAPLCVAVAVPCGSCCRTRSIHECNPPECSRPLSPPVSAWPARIPPALPPPKLSAPTMFACALPPALALDAPARLLRTTTCNGCLLRTVLRHSAQGSLRICVEQASQKTWPQGRLTQGCTAPPKKSRQMAQKEFVAILAPLGRDSRAWSPPCAISSPTAHVPPSTRRFLRSCCCTAASPTTGEGERFVCRAGSASRGGRRWRRSARRAARSFR